MTTIVRNTKIPHNPRVVKGQKNRRTADAVAPSVKGIAARKLAGIVGAASIVGDTLQLVSYAQRLGKLKGDAEVTKAAGACIRPIAEQIDALRSQVDSILREQNATSNDDPEQMVTETHGTSAVSAASDAAIRHARFSVAQDNAESLGAVNPARIAAGLPDDVPEDVYEHMKNLSK